MKKTIFAALMAFFAAPAGVFADSETVIRDLAPYTTVKLDVELKVVPHETSVSEVYARVVNPFTNTILCVLDLSLPVRRRGNDGVFNMSQTDVLVFPQGTFADQAFSQVFLTGIPANTEIAAVSGTILETSASCRGWGMGKRLPRRTCLQLAPNYEQSCVAARSAGMKYIPLVRGNLHMGDCAC